MNYKEESIKILREELPEQYVQMVVGNVDKLSEIGDMLFKLLVSIAKEMLIAMEDENLTDSQRELIMYTCYAPIRQHISFIQSEGMNPLIKEVYQEIESSYIEFTSKDKKS